ncbi:MAG: methyltransferase domain-containing protein [Candidatus Micrarchaeota archaeon]
MARVLNIGCGEDFTIGTDFVDLYPQKDDVKQCDIDKDRLPYDDGTFDEVYTKNLFEHLTNPANLMKEANRVLKKGGRLTLITDNAAYLGIGFGKTLFLHNYSGYGKEDRHFEIYTAFHMRNWADKFGFEVESIDYLMQKDSPSAFLRIVKSVLLPLLPKHLSGVNLKLVAKKK